MLPNSLSLLEEKRRFRDIDIASGILGARAQKTRGGASRSPSNLVDGVCATQGQRPNDRSVTRSDRLDGIVRTGPGMVVPVVGLTVSNKAEDMWFFSSSQKQPILNLEPAKEELQGSVSAARQGNMAACLRGGNLLALFRSITACYRLLRFGLGRLMSDLARIYIAV